MKGKFILLFILLINCWTTFTQITYNNTTTVGKDAPTEIRAAQISIAPAISVNNTWGESGWQEVRKRCGTQYALCLKNSNCSAYLKQVQACPDAKCINSLPQPDQLYLNLWQCIADNNLNIKAKVSNQAAWSRTIWSTNTGNLYHGNDQSMNDALGATGIRAIQDSCGNYWEKCQGDDYCSRQIKSALSCSSNACLQQYNGADAPDTAQRADNVATTVASANVQAPSVIQGLGMCILQNQGCIISAAANPTQYRWIVNVAYAPVCYNIGQYWYWPYWNTGCCNDCCNDLYYPNWWWWYGNYWGAWYHSWWRGCWGKGWWGWWGWYGWYPYWGYNNNCCNYWWYIYY